MYTRGIGTCALALAALAVFGAQPAHAGWSAPLTLSGSQGGAAPALGSSPQGGATVLWSDPSAGAMRTLAANGSPGPRERFFARRPATKPAVAVDAAGSRFVAWYGRARGGEGLALHTRRIGPGGRRGPIMTIVPRVDSFDRDIAIVAGRRGATLAWTSADRELLPDLKTFRRTRSTVTVAQLAPNGRLGRLRRLPGAGIDQGPRLVASRGGAVTVVWQRESDGASMLLAARRDAAGRFGAAQAIAPSGVYGEAPAVAGTAAGAAIVAWRASGATGDPRQESVLMARRLAADGRPAAAAIQLAPPGSYGTPSVALAAGGAATAVWSRWSDSGSVVQARRLGAGGDLGPTVDVASATTTVAAQVAVDRRGRGAIVWTPGEPFWQGEGERPAVAIEARTLARGGRLGPARSIAAQPADRAIHDVALGVDGRGTATVAWAAVSGGRNAIRVSRLPAR